MKFNPKIHHRRSIRLKGYNYSSAGKYFITICSQKKECLFGNIDNGKMLLSDAGIIAHSCWREIPEHFPFVCLDEFVIMPDHIHGIIYIMAGANDYSPEHAVYSPHQAHPPERDLIHCPRPRGTSKTIGSIVRGYKIGVTKWFRQNKVDYRIWQRDYYEHIIRDDNELHRIRNYIINNPVNWYK